MPNAWLTACRHPALNIGAKQHMIPLLVGVAYNRPDISFHRRREDMTGA